MFKLFSKTEKVAPVAPSPAVEDIVLSAEQQKAFDVLVPDEDGFVRIGNVTHGLLREQSQYITRYMDGSNPRVPVLVDGLRVDVSSSSHHEYRIHRDDAIQFISRVKAHRGR